MKRTDLERWLRSHGAERVSGKARGGHDRWLNPRTGAGSFISRHREIAMHTGRAICAPVDETSTPYR